MRMTTYWFRPKRYGYGAIPCTWQGWALTLAVGGFAITRALALEDQIVRLFIEVIIVALVFSFIAKQKTKGEWKWRWGENSVTTKERL